MRLKKPWRVDVEGLDQQLFSSQAKAYNYAKPYTAQTRFVDLTVLIYHWENDSWRLYERYSKESS